jgi:hypothetical protein
MGETMQSPQTLTVILDATHQERNISVLVARRWSHKKELVLKPNLKYAGSWYLCGSVKGRQVSIPLSKIHGAEIV